MLPGLLLSSTGSIFGDSESITLPAADADVGSCIANVVELPLEATSERTALAAARGEAAGEDVALTLSTAATDGFRLWIRGEDVRRCDALAMDAVSLLLSSEVEAVVAAAGVAGAVAAPAAAAGVGGAVVP